MIVCSHCGQEAQMNDRYCKGCGHRFSLTDGDYTGGSLGAETGFMANGGTSYTSWAGSNAGTPSANLGTASGSGTLTSAYDGNHATDANGAHPAVAVGVATSETAASEADTSEADTGVADTSPSAASMPSSVGRLIVRMMNGNPGDEREYLLDGQTITVGRSPSCDVVLEADPLISRRHALLKYEYGRYMLVDLGSSNGTYINETEIHEAVPLRDGDRILLGEHELTYSTEPASATAAQTGVNPRSAFAVASPPPRTDPHIPAVDAQMSGEEPTVPGPTLEDVAEATTTLMVQTPAGAGYGATGPTFITPALESDSGAAQPTFAVAHADGAADVPEAPEANAVPTESAATNSTGDALVAESLAAQAIAVTTPDTRPVDLAAQSSDATPVERATEATDEVDGQTLASLSAYATGTAAETGSTFSAPAPVSGPPSMPKPGDSLIDHIAAIQDYAQHLRQRTENAEQLSAQHQQALAEARERLGAILSEQQRYAAPVDDGEDLMPLIEIARQAAENPRHLDTVTQLSEHAQDILNALQRRQAVQSAPIEAQRALQDLYDWLGRQG